MSSLAISKILRDRRNKANIMQRLANKLDSSEDSGFTLLELLVVIGMVAILSTIAGVSWLAFVNNQRLGTANEAILRAMREAQSEAKRTKLEQQISFRQSTSGGDPIFQWAVHKPETTIPADSPLWNDSEGNIQIDDSADYTNLDNTEDVDGDGTNDWSIRFDHYGGLVKPEEIVETNPPRITIMSATSETAKRCVAVRTLLGSMQARDGSCHVTDFGGP